MARRVTKNIASAHVYALDGTKDFKVDDDGMPLPNVDFYMDGNPHPNRARMAAEKYVGHKNIMVIKVDVDETKVSVSPDRFYQYSSPCLEGISYGHDTITATFEFTTVRGFYMDAEGMHQFEEQYPGVTTDARLLNHIRELKGTQMAAITSKQITEDRRWMYKTEYLALAR